MPGFDRNLTRSALFALAGLITLGATGPAAAQAWPVKPVRLVVPFAAGGATDVVARILGQKLGELWGQSVVIENRGGAGGNVGADVVAKATNDGYTLLMASGSIVTVNQHMYKRMPFDAQKDFAPITKVATGPMLVIVNPGVPAANIKALIALAKAKPGSINFGSAGVGSQVHMAAEWRALSDVRSVRLRALPARPIVGAQLQLPRGVRPVPLPRVRDHHAWRGLPRKPRARD